MGILPFLASVACYEFPTEQRREQHVLLCCFLYGESRDEEVQRTLSWAAATGDPAKSPSAERYMARNSHGAYIQVSWIPAFIGLKLICNCRQKRIPA